MNICVSTGRVFYCILRDIYAVYISAGKSMISLTRPAWDIGTIYKVFVRTFAQNFEFLSPHTPSLTTHPTESSPKGSTQSNSEIPDSMSVSSVIGDRWSVIGDRWSVIGDRWSVIGDRWLVIGDRWSWRVTVERGMDKAFIAQKCL